MKQTYSIPKTVLWGLQKKFKNAGCDCSLKNDTRKTILTIGYSNVIQLNNQIRSAG